jgi:plastocyanin
MKLFLALALLAAPGAMAVPCPADIVGPGRLGKPGPPDGAVNVEDLIAVLGKFGVKNPPFDPVLAGKSKGVIDIEDLLELLKTFGKKGCTKPSTAACSAKDLQALSNAPPNAPPNVSPKCMTCMMKNAAAPNGMNKCVSFNDMVAMARAEGMKKCPKEVGACMADNGCYNEFLAMVRTDKDPVKATASSKMWDAHMCMTTIKVNWVIRAYGPMTANVGDTVFFTWGGNHNVFLHPSGTCNQRGSTLVGSRSARNGKFTFTKPGKYTFACQVGSHCNQGQIVTFTVGGGGSAPPPPPSGPAPVCANSPRQACKMMCPPVRISCPMGQCAMRQGNCCNFKCSQAGGVVMPPTPPTPTCIAGQSCGGQTMQGCGTACPKVCGQPPRMMCMRMCKRGYQCPQAGSPSGMWWDARAGKCVPSKGACTPMLVIGRPFIVDATPMMASAVQSVSSDWL